MNIINDWQKIRTHFSQSFRSNFHVSIASVDADGKPNVTPIGSLFLNDNQSGFYFEKYPTKLPLHAKGNNSVCVLAVNSNSWFWMKALFRGRFNSNPGIKLYGELGTKRQATENEIKRLNRRMKATQGLKGNTYLWADMRYIREVTFTHAEMINLGKMTSSI